MNLLTFIDGAPDNPLLMRPWFFLVVALCVVAVSAALVALLVALARVGRRAEGMLALVERELEQDVPPLMEDLHELGGELLRLGQGASAVRAHRWVVTRRVEAADA